nr:YwmB family TATA-box binding protein [uncultured Cellulosilyticum sp.]
MKHIKHIKDRSLMYIKNIISDKCYLGIILVAILSIAYIFTLDTYDRGETQVAKLYKAVSVKGINYEQIEVNVKGVTENRQLPIEEVMAKEKACNDVLSHTKECSKLCAIIHPVNGEVEVLAQDDYISATTSNTQDMSTYTLTIKSEERNPDTTVYNMKIQGLQDVATIDNMRNKSIDLFKEWDTNPNETISFVGYIDGQLDTAQKQNYKTQIFKSLNGRFVTYYQDDYNPTTQAYYGYTPLVKEYTTTTQGTKTNTQVTFTYNEILDQTQVIIAFPFYNQPY